MMKVSYRDVVAVMLSTASFPAMAQTQVQTSPPDMPVAASDPMLQAPTATPADQTASPGDVDIVVTGIRQSLANAASIKRNTMEVVDSITATDIGKLPDPNVAETLTRVPGVQAYRFGGEASSPVGSGSGITIRGLTGQTASRTNGRAYFSAGQREFNIEGTSPAMVAGVDVFKNPSAEHIEGGIGGIVNVRTRRPFDFKGLAAAASVGGKYNDLADRAEPDVFGLVSNRWDVGGGELGVLLAASFLRTVNRGDNTPAPGGLNFRRAIRADSTEYAAGVTSGLYSAAYRGRADVTYLADVSPATVATAERSTLIAAVAQQPIIAQEQYVRTRKGFNSVVQYRPSSTLEFYVEGLYNEFLYHQQYRFLGPADSRYVQNLGTTSFYADEGLANRNSNGGTDDQLSGQRITGGTFLGSGFSSTGGDEHRRYQTAVASAGAKWNPTERLDVNLDVTYVRAYQKQDNRNATLAPAAGLSWDITRDLTRDPSYLTISGPDLAAPDTWVFSQYGNGTNQVFRDDGIAVALDTVRRFDDSILKDVKVGLRYATQNDDYRNFSFSNRNLTTNGLTLTASRGNGISVSGLPDLVQTSPTNFFDGRTGYAGGFLVVSPDALLGDNIRNSFPAAGLLPEDALVENVVNRRVFREKTYAGYAVADFGVLDDRIKGNAGVRVVKTDTFVRAQVSTASGIQPRDADNSYTDVLPTLNLTGYLTRDTLMRFAYGKGITRPDPAALNPSVVVNLTSGQASVGNADLRPQKADSYDLSLEHYFSRANYVSAAVFYKRIDGFFSSVSSCQTVNGFSYTGVTPSGCPTDQFFVTQTVNAQKGTAKGVEVSAQSFLDYDFVPDALHGLGGSASFTYVDTRNPVLLSNGILVVSQQPFTSKYNYSLTGFYEDTFVSARVVYTYRSRALFQSVALNPIDSRYAQGFGLLDASINFNLPHRLQLSITASNLTNKAPNRYYGEPSYYTGIQRQAYLNGRVFGAALRYSFGS
jgi:TonB-dependent receptor